ncbi:tyrosine-type recombinase/integrase [Pseudomonas sp.]|uniref:tyrosine-type recombinase/integrase n=1 Tax=Pseudomonas sp. TaxID=306 RepID=UPI003F34179D
MTDVSAPSETLHVLLTDAAIRQYAATPVRQLRDPRFPALRFRYSSTNRAKGSWFVVVGDKWGKAGNYPDINAKAMQATLPAILLRRAAEPGARSTVNSWQTVGDLLTWYLDRMSRDHGLSAKRKASARSAVRCQLQPRLNALSLTGLDRASLDQMLLWPMQERYALSFVRSVYGVLTVAFRQAARLGLIVVNPMASLKFNDFVQTRIKPKPAHLRAEDLEEVLANLGAEFANATAGCMLVLMMLCHGTRLGETRVARWKYINLTRRQWFIPADETKTKRELTLPLTDQVCTLLLRYREHQTARGYVGAYLFPGQTRHPLSANQASQVFVRLSQGSWTSHDLRKVARTAWMDLGVDYLVGEMLVNHAMNTLTATYIHTSADTLKRKALEDWHAWLDQRGFAALHTGTGPGQATSTTVLHAPAHKALGQSQDPLPRRMF